MTTLRIGHSPDPDDAFMWYPLANDPSQTGPDGKPLTPKVDTRGYDFVHVLEDIQSLNERSLRGELEITAISIHQYPYVADKYALTTCGASMGDGYGPMIVTKNPNLTVDDLAKVKIAIPGEQTSAFLALSILLGERVPNYDVVMFDEINAKVAAGEYEAGLIIHEAQLTYKGEGLRCLLDLGQWWTESRKLPLPLGGNCIRRDLGQPAMSQVCAVLLDSIQWSLDHREACVEYALRFGRGLEHALADEFVGMYVNELTLDYGQRGRDAVRGFLREAVQMQLVPDCGEVDFIEPSEAVGSRR